MIKCRIEGCDNPAAKNIEGRQGLRCRSCEHLTSSYGITTPERNKMLEDQNGKCKLCLKPIMFPGDSSSKNNNSGCIDHTSHPFKIRGILCGTCNTALGKLGDKPETIKRALDYVNGEL